MTCEQALEAGDSASHLSWLTPLMSCLSSAFQVCLTRTCSGLATAVSPKPLYGAAVPTNSVLQREQVHSRRVQSNPSTELKDKVFKLDIRGLQNTIYCKGPDTIAHVSTKQKSIKVCLTQIPPTHASHWLDGIHWVETLRDTKRYQQMQ